MAKDPVRRNITRKTMAKLERQRRQSRYIITGAIITAVVVLGVILYGILDQTVLKQNKVVAEAAGSRISYAQFEKMVKFNRFLQLRNVESYLTNSIMLQLYGSTIQQMVNSLQDTTGFAQSALDGLVNDAYIQREATNRGITVSDEELRVEMEQAFGYYAQGTPTPPATAAAFATATLNATQEGWLPPTLTPMPSPTLDKTTPTVTATLEPTSGPSATPEATPTTGPTFTPLPSSTPYTEEGYRTTYSDFLVSIKPLGLDEAFLRQYISSTILRRKLADDLAVGMDTSQEYIWARNILVATQEEAYSVLERLNMGTPWNELAAEVSLDTSNKDRGGDLGWFTHGAMVAAFEDAAYALNIGEVSAPVQTEIGYHIIQLLGRETRPMDAYQIDQAKSDHLTEFLDQAKIAEPPILNDYWKNGQVPSEPAVPDNIIAILNELNAQMPNP